MSSKIHRKVDIAREQLETALRLHFEGGVPFSVLTLAGSAEELLGKHLSAMGDRAVLDDIVLSAVLISAIQSGTASDPKNIRNLANRAKNSSKHMDGAHDSEFAADIEREALAMLNRAVDNFCLLQLPYSDLINRFNQLRGRNAA